jgi:hypothetical protein
VANRRSRAFFLSGVWREGTAANLEIRHRFMQCMTFFELRGVLLGHLHHLSNRLAKRLEYGAPFPVLQAFGLSVIPLRVVDVKQPLSYKEFTHAIGVERPFSGCEPTPFFNFARVALHTQLSNMLRISVRHDDNTVIVGNNDVARMH